jgi:hypothetical protein
MFHRMSLLGLIAFLAAACSGTDAGQTPTQPSETSSKLSIAVSTMSSTIVAQPVINALCPVVSPFTLPMVVVVQPSNSIGFVVTTISVRFVDTSGVMIPQMQLPAPMPTTQFGTALDNSRNAQVFPVTLPVGCASGIKGNVQIMVQARDAMGRTASGYTTVTVR